MNHALLGLASSVLLNLGLTRIAEKLDTVHGQSGRADAASESCWLCHFTPESELASESCWLCHFTPEAAR